MNQPTSYRSVQEYDRLTRLRVMRHIGTAGLEQLSSKLAQAEAGCDQRGARAIIADMQTIELWLRWVEREERRLTAPRHLAIVPSRAFAHAPHA